MNKYLIILFLFSFLKADDISLDKKETTTLIKKEKVFFIKPKEENKKLKIDIITSIHGLVLEYKSPRLDINLLNKDTNIIVYSKSKKLSLNFFKNLKNLGFNKIYILKNGEDNFWEIIKNFRGIKLFSIFQRVQ